MKYEIYKCNICGNLTEKIIDMGPKVICCGEEMELLTANTTDAAVEKHIPVVKEEGNRLIVEVGSVLHPMTAEHNIKWIAVVKESSVERYNLDVGSEPRITIDKTDYKGIYAYCNLHGLWKVN